MMNNDFEILNALKMTFSILFKFEKNLKEHELDICTKKQILITCISHYRELVSSVYLSDENNLFIGIGIHLELGYVMIFSDENNMIFLCSPIENKENMVPYNPNLCLYGLYLLHRGFNKTYGIKHLLQYKGDNIISYFLNRKDMIHNKDKSEIYNIIYSDYGIMDELNFYKKYNNKNIFCEKIIELKNDILNIFCDIYKNETKENIAKRLFEKNIVENKKEDDFDNFLIL